MTLLGGVLRLHNVTDVERLCAAVLERQKASIPASEHADVLAYLIACCWELSLRYDPAKDKKPNFAAYASFVLARRLVDWRRARYGRTRFQYADRTIEHERRPAALSLDAPIGDDGTADGSGRSDTLGSTLAGESGDFASNWDSPFGGALDHGDQSRDRDYELLRALVAQEIAERARASREWDIERARRRRAAHPRALVD